MYFSFVLFCAKNTIATSIHTNVFLIHDEEADNMVMWATTSVILDQNKFSRVHTEENTTI